MPSPHEIDWCNQIDPPCDYQNPNRTYNENCGIIQQLRQIRKRAKKEAFAQAMLELAVTDRDKFIDTCKSGKGKRFT